MSSLLHLQTLSLGLVLHPRKSLDLDPDTHPVGFYSEIRTRSFLAKQLKVPLSGGRTLTDQLATISSGNRLGGFAVTGLVKWLITALLLMGFVLAVHFYQGRVLSDNDKSIFESIIVTLSLVVGLNIASALKDIAKHMRWWFLSLKRRDLSEVRVLFCRSLLRPLGGTNSGIISRSSSFCIVTA